MKLTPRKSITFTRKATLAAISVSLVTAIASAVSWAGMKNTAPVVIDLTNRFAGGSLGDARNSQDAIQYIGCSSIGGTSQNSMYCSAKDAAGTYVNCTSSDSRLIDETRALTGESAIQFSWDANANCTSLYVATYSVYFPMQP
jgi:hypothetical protein